MASASTPARVSGAPCLQVDNLTPAALAPAGGRLAWAPLSFSLAPGERLALVGPRGAGKTRLARAVTLIDRPAQGRVLFEGVDVTRAWGGRLRALRRGLQYVGGDARRSLSPRLSIEQVLAEPLEVHRLGSPAERRARVAAAAQAWQLHPLVLGQHASALSGTLCQRITLARASLLEPRVLVCDGLAERLEPAAVRPLLALVTAVCRAAGMAWVWTTRQPDLAADFADRVIVLE